MRIRNQRLPIGYREVEYLESTGTQYINTGYANTSTPYQIDCDMEITGEVMSNYWFGQNQGHGSMIFNGLYNQNALEYNWLTVSRTSNKRCIMTQTLSQDGTTVTITMNGVSSNKVVGTNDSTGNFLIFACNPSNSTPRNYGSNLRLYSFRIHEGNTNIRNFIPCIRTSDSKPGLYDTVNFAFYTNQGTGEFLYGGYNDSYDISLYSNNSIKKCEAALSLYQPKIVLDTVDTAKKIATIKLVRAYTGLALRAAKDLVDAVKAGTPQVLKELYSTENNYCNCDSAFIELQVQTVNFSEVNATISLQHS